MDAQACWSPAAWNSTWATVHSEQGVGSSSRSVSTAPAVTWRRASRAVVSTAKVTDGSSRWVLPGCRAGRSGECREELPDVLDEQVGGVVRGPVPAAVIGVPGDDGVVVAFGEPAHGVEVEGEGGQADRHGGGLGGIGVAGGTVVLVVEPGRRGGGVGEPVQRHIGQDVLGAERGAEQLTAPGQLPGRRVRQ